MQFSEEVSLKRMERYPKSEGKRETRRRFRNKERLTIMIFKGAGEVRRFTISSRLVLFALLFCLFYIVPTIYFTNKYFYTSRINKMQRDKIAELSKVLIKTTKSLERSKHHIALLDDYISKSKDQSSEPEFTVNHTESPLPKIVDIDGLKVKRDRSTINITFSIVNRQSNGEPIGGYIFALASVKDSDQSEVCVYPGSLLKEGLPVNYRSGHRFFIQNFLPISSKLRLSKSIDKPLILEILVYDRDGELILKKEVEV